MEDSYQDRSLPEDPVVAHASGAEALSDTHENLDSGNPTLKNYYAILNVHNTATQEDINAAYERLDATFHPDKHTDPSLKEAAESKRQVIRKAFEVLSNPELRATYDTYGEGGLSAKWEVGHRVKSPQELRDEYARLAQEKHQMDLENLVRSRNGITINVNASRVFQQPRALFRGTLKKDRYAGILDSLKRTEVMELYMKNTFQTQLGPRTQVILGSNMSSQSGIGGNGITGTIQHTFSDKLAMEFGTSLLSPGASVIKATYNIDSDTYVSGAAFTKHFQGPTPLVVTLGRRISKGATGYMTYRTGEWALGSWGLLPEERTQFSSMSLGIRSLNTKDTYEMELQASVLQSYLLADRTWTVDESTRIRVGTKLSSFSGLSTSIGADRRLTEHTKLGVAFELALSGGVAVNLRVMRLGQSVTVPILLSTNFKAKFAFWAAIVPMCALAALDFGVIKPRNRRQRANKLRELREVHSEFIANQRKEAEEAIRLLRDSTARKVKQEQDKDGLVIIEATYGNLNAGIVTDVTIAVQALVHNSQLVMPGGHSKNHILGFYDPCLGEKKQLRIRYEFQKRMHEVVVADMDHVVLPVRSHLTTA
ncbi:hypothetical protein B0O80DRAFT_462011 [Mortierella sp. GBAus27b]|nr:hypothetical protein B0O80DRAFT_462011 [Mortierella sp. GBAus27b]